jgi:hypothetical protein
MDRVGVGKDEEFVIFILGKLIEKIMVIFKL